MGKKNQFIKAIGMSTVFVIGSTASTIAEEAYKSNSTNSDVRLTSETLAQSASPPDIIEPAKTPIEDLEPLNPSEDLLSLPDNVEEVEVDTEQPITLEQAIELALRNNQDVLAAQVQLAQSEDVLREARAALLPTLDLGSGLDYSNSAFLDSVNEQIIEDRGEGSLTNPETSSFTFNTSLTLGYNIYTGGSRGASIRAAQKQLRSSELQLETTLEQVKFEASRDYYELQNSDASVGIEEAAVEDAQQTLKDAQLLERAGLGTRFDVLRAEVELAQAEQRLSTAKANQNISRRQLAETLSVSHSTDLSTADTIEEAGVWELSLSESIVKAFQNRAELEQFLLQRDIANEQRTIALSNIRPTLSADAAYNISDDFEDSFDISDQYSVGLNLQWRLYDGGAARAAARQSEKDSEIAEIQFADQRDQIRFAVEQAFYGLEANQDNIGTASKEVELAEESLRLARLRFQAGVGTQTDVIEAQTQLTTARGNLLSSIIDYNQSYVDLQRQVSKVSGVTPQ
ncbi:MAG: TolC family protein [Cyanobacteria bacterium P01_G01_bin.19]